MVSITMPTATLGITNFETNVLILKKEGQLESHLGCPTDDSLKYYYSMRLVPRSPGVSYQIHTLVDFQTSEETGTRVFNV